VEIRSITAGLAFLLMMISSAFGGITVRKTVQAGVTTELHAYTSWQQHTCATNGGVVRPVSKPQHGTLIPRKGTRMFPTSRHGPDECAGRAYPAFVIFYRSDPNFRGVDSFSVEVTFGGSATGEVDDYTVTVK
jgi:hypothetical protein